MTQICFSDEKSFLSEVTIFHRLTECPHVVRLLGLCTDHGHYAIVMEHVGNGDLESMLLSEVREHHEIRKWSCRLKMSLEIAKGMNFLHRLNSLQNMPCFYLSKVPVYLARPPQHTTRCFSKSRTVMSMTMCVKRLLQQDSTTRSHSGGGMLAKCTPLTGRTCRVSQT